jgi:hypothetical protein
MLDVLAKLDISGSLESVLCWRAGCSEKLPVRFGEGWAETYIRKDATRRPSTLWALVRASG